MGIRHLGQPCRARNVHAGVVVEDGGQTWFVITNTNENANMELIFIDAAGDRGAVYRAPAGSGAWAIHKIPGNRLLVGTYYDGMFMVFDVAKRAWVKTVKFPGEDYIWTLAQGKDGRLYGGTYPGGKLGALNPDTFAFEDLGAPGKPNLYLRYTSALPDGRIFCQFGFTATKTMIFDPATGQFSPAPENMQGVTAGVSWNGFFLAGDKAYRMPDLSVTETLPFPAPDPSKGAWSVDTRLTDEKTLVLRQGTAVLTCKEGDSALTTVFTMPQQGAGALLARSENGDFYGIRGQDYFVMGAKRKRANADLRIIPGEAAPRGTHFLYVDDRGRLWGGPTFGQTLFHLDTETGKYINTRTISDHGGEVYDVEVIDGICYAVAYVGGEIIRYDPGAPWEQVKHINPKTIARVGPEYIRPQAGVTRGDDGRLYSGWLAKYGEYGGALAVTEPRTGKNRVFKNPLGPHGIAGCAPVGNGLVLLGTTLYGNGLGNQKNTPSRLGLFDTAAGKSVWTRDLPGIGSIHNIVYDAAAGFAAFLAGGQLYLLDPARREIPGSGPLFPDKVTSHNLALAPGRVLYARDETIYSLDLKTHRPSPIAQTPGKVAFLAFGGPKKRVYFSCGVDVYEHS